MACLADGGQSTLNCQDHRACDFIFSCVAFLPDEYSFLEGYEVHSCRELFALLKGTCLHCCRLRIAPAQRTAHVKKLRLLLSGRVTAAARVFTPMRTVRKRKPRDEQPQQGEASDEEAVDVDEAMDVGSEYPREAQEGGDMRGDFLKDSGNPVTSNVLAELQV
jgi:hypothetical protein